MEILIGFVVILSLLNAIFSLPSGKLLQSRGNAVAYLSTAGAKAANNQFPHHVTFFKSEGDTAFFLCSGAIVDESQVVTTASAVGYNATFNMADFNLFVGSNEVLGGDTAPFRIQSLRPHPNYTSMNNENDIIIFQVTPAFNFSNAAVKPITISTNFTLDTSLDCTISTFADPAGEFDDGVSEYLEWTNVSQITCPDQPQPSDSLFCAGNKTSQTNTITITDRGSPLICNSRLVGLVTSSQETYLTNVTKYYDFIFPTVPNSTTEQPPNKTNTSVSDSVFNNNFVRIIVIVAVAFVIAIGSFALIVKFCFLISKK